MESSAGRLGRSVRVKGTRHIIVVFTKFDTDLIDRHGCMLICNSHLKKQSSTRTSQLYTMAMSAFFLSQTNMASSKSAMNFQASPAIKGTNHTVHPRQNEFRYPDRTPNTLQIHIPMHQKSAYGKLFQLSYPNSKTRNSSIDHCAGVQTQLMQHY